MSSSSAAAVAALPALPRPALRVAKSGERRLYYASTPKHLDRCTFDDDYLRRLREGDAEAHNHFFAYFRQLIAIKSRAIRSRQLTEDIQQETMARVWQAVQAQTIQSAGALGAYVYNVCENVTKELLRKESRYAADAGLGEQVDPAPGAEDTLVSLERKRAVQQVLKQLPAKDAQILVMLYWEETDRDAICARMQVDREYLRVLAFRTREKFRSLLKKDKLWSGEVRPPAPRADTLAGY